MTALPAKTSISDTYPNPSNATARAGFAQLWDVISETIEKPELDLASATTCDIGGQLSTKLRIAGATTITSFGTNYRGPILLRMAAALTITHNSTTLICPGNTSLITTAGDTLMAWPKATSGIVDGWQLVRLEAGLGVGQAWQDMTASRAIFTGYPNSTGRSILLCVKGELNTSGARIEVSCNGPNIASSNAIATAPAVASVNGILIPAGAQYAVAPSAGTLTSMVWMELR